MDSVAGESKLLRLVARERVYRYYYTGLTCDVVERGVLAGSVPASSATLEDLAVKGWVVPLPGTSRYMRGQWTLTDAGREEIERLMGGKG